VLAVAAPREGCALVLGRRDPDGDLHLDWIWPCANVWEPDSERGRRFRIDPREQLLAQKWGRGRGWLVLGSAHSHPRGVAEPSATDRSLAVGPTLMLILAPELGAGPAELECRGRLGCWWLPASDDGVPGAGPEAAAPRRLRWRMED
jgi:proteasome lid subunit RPN8/RPN11